MRHRPRGLPASLLLSSSPLYDEFEVVRVEDHAPTPKRCDVCGGLAVMHCTDCDRPLCKARHCYSVHECEAK